MLDYYTLQETLKMLTESSNDKYTYTARDIATLCRQSILTPVFAYSNDCMEILEYYDESKPIISKNGGETEYDTSRAPEPMTTHFHDGYLTDKRLLSLLDESQNKLELFSVMTYESDGSGCEIALVTNGGYTITRERLLFPSEQVRNYIASNQNIEQNTPEQNKVNSDFKKVTPDSDKPSYTTSAIAIMNAVIEKFWIDYDPDQPAPKQSTITNWMVSNFDITPALALNIDKVCRHDSAKSGGKYKR